MSKKKLAIKKDVPVKKTKTNIPDDEKCLTATVEIENNALCCKLDLSKDDVETLVKSTGCKVFDAAKAIITTGMSTSSGGVKGQVAIEAAYNEHLAMMAELKPQDAFEGMLVSQMSVTYIQALDCMRMAADKKEYSKIYERLQNQGIKLMRLYNYQLETLDKHRNKGRQKMTVEHVHVHPGGQAIVGNVTQGEGGGN